MWGLAALGAICSAGFAWSLVGRVVITSPRGVQIQLEQGQIFLVRLQGIEAPGWDWYFTLGSSPPRWLAKTPDWGWSIGIIVSYGLLWSGAWRVWYIGVVLWPVALAGWGGAGLLWHLGRRDARRLKAGLCPTCGYSLAGLGPGLSCPECGERGVGGGGGVNLKAC